ncbi:DUF6709 family protein [Silvibacterium acidisoli]|uniref:DUF6709 family protein n=1 Tax=Acidobacteriaceae bacterium ZG23-2 TaxID=2883246 RepID=UPI00406BFB2D
MWDGFCGDVIRRGNKRTVIVAGVILLGVAIFYACNLPYFTGFFLGGHAVTAAELAAAKGAGDFRNSFLKVGGGETIAAGLDEITKDKEHPEGYVSARFAVTTIGGKNLLVRLDPQYDLFLGDGQKTYPSFEVTGHVKPLTDYQKDMVAHAEALGDAPYLPFVLDAYEYKEFGWFSVVITGGLAVFGAWLLVLYMQRTGDFAKHPFAKQLARHGELAMLIPQVDSECAGAHFTARHRTAAAHITPHWYIVTTAMGGSISRLDSLQWVHRTVIKRKLYYFITIGKTYQLNTYDSFGKRILAQLGDEKSNETMAMLRNVAPQALFGYDKRLLKLWKSMKSRGQSTFAAEARQLVGDQPLASDAITSNRYARY